MLVRTALRKAKSFFILKKLSVICETVRIMGVIIKFQDCSDIDYTVLQVSVQEDEFISIGIENEKSNAVESVWMDIETAVKFSKELRKQIAIAKDYQLKSETNE